MSIGRLAPNRHYSSPDTLVITLVQVLRIRREDQRGFCLG